MKSTKEKYQLLSVESNSFGDQLITIYNNDSGETLFLCNPEGNWVNPDQKVRDLNRQLKLNKKVKL